MGEPSSQKGHLTVDPVDTSVTFAEAIAWAASCAGWVTLLWLVTRVADIDPAHGVHEAEVVRIVGAQVAALLLFGVAWLATAVAAREMTPVLVARRTLWMRRLTLFDGLGACVLVLTWTLWL